MSNYNDDVALDAALTHSGVVIRELAASKISDSAAGTYRLSGAYKIVPGLVANLLIDIVDATRAPGTNGVRITLPRAGVSGGTPAVGIGSGISISGTPFYWQSGDGVWQNFNVVVVLDADAWTLEVDPFATSGQAGEPVIFRRLEVDRTA